MANHSFRTPPPYHTRHSLRNWIARAALAAVALAALFVALGQTAEAQSTVRKPSVAVSAPGVLVMYTAKGGDSPGCTSTVEYNTSASSANPPTTVNVNLGNTKQKGDHYRFTTAELTAGRHYYFRVQHTAGTNVDACQPHNTWSGWSHAIEFKGQTISNIGAVSVTAKKATGRGDTTGAPLTNNQVQRGSWVALHFEPVNGGRFPHHSKVQACSRKNGQDSDWNDCSTTGNLFPGKEFLIKRGAREHWQWFQVSSTEWGNNSTINLRFRAVSQGHKYWQWEAPIAKCWTRHGAYDLCKRLQLTAKTNVSDSPPDSTPPDELIEVEGVPQSEQLSFVPDATVVANVRSYAAETERGSVHVERWQRVLIGLGVESYAGLTAMAASEAQVFADYGWARWVPVASELAKAEAAQQAATQQQEQADDSPPAYTPPASLVADVRSYVAETSWGSVHVERWKRVLIGLGVESYNGLTALTAAEAQVFADNGWARWIPVASELAKAEAAQ